MGLLDRCEEKRECDGMERLTVECDGQAVPRKLCTFDKYGEAVDCDSCPESNGNCEGNCDECPVQECFDKLAEYEKTGITPEQIREISEMYRDLATELGKFKKAEEQGLLLMLPCEVGDTVYEFIPFCETCEKPLDDLYACEYCKKGEFISEAKFDYEMIEMFGKTVFLTREEAEKALAEKEIENETD